MYDKNITFLEHLNELRNRLIVVVIVLIVIFFICFSKADSILNIVLEPVNYAELIYISPSDLLITLVRVSAITALLLSLPMIILQVFLFIKPAFNREETLDLVVIILASVILLILGLLFGYFVMLPMSLRFFMNIEVAEVKPTFVLNNYIGYVLSLVFMCGIAFQLPLVVIALERLNIISLAKLTASRKYVLLIVAIIAALLTPPDVVSQSILIIPMMLLYEFSIILVRIFRKKNKNKELET